MLSLGLSVLLSAAAVEPKVVVLLPLGPVDAAAVASVKQAIEERLEVTVRVDAPRELPKEAFYAPRKRWRAEKLLEAIDADPPPDAWKVVALTAAEISTTKGDVFDWGIAGLGNMGGRSCVASTYLYKKYSKTKAQMLRRFTDVSVHELGHTLGMPHCETTGCVMSDAKGKAIASADASRGHYCDACRRRAPKDVLKPRPEGVLLLAPPAPSVSSLGASPTTR